MEEREALAMLDSFDPSGLASPREGVEELREYGIEVGFRAAARLLALGRKRVRFSLAFLEAVGEKGEEEAVLMDPAWNQGDHFPVEAVRQLIGARPASALEVEGVVHVVIPDEAPAEGALVVAPSSESLLASVAGSADPAAFSGILWDRRKMEKASLCLLDAEDPQELIESFRYLFRALVTTGQSPMSLLVTALKREKPELSQEVARQVQEHLSRELGRAMRAVLSAEPKPLESALNYLLGEDGRAWSEVLEVLLLPALRAALARPEGRSVVLLVLERTVGRTSGDIQELESFLDTLVDTLPEFTSAQRLGFGRYLERLHCHYPFVSGYLLTQLKVARSPQEAVFFGFILSRLELVHEERDVSLDRMVELFASKGLETALEERLKTIFLSFGKVALERLSQPEYLEQLEPGKRSEVIGLWNTFREEDRELPPQEIFISLALAAIQDRRRDTVLALVRSGQLKHPALLDRLKTESDPQELVLYLTGEAFRLEEPDDEQLFPLLVPFGALALERPFARLHQEATLHSAAAAHRLLFFGRLAYHLDLEGSDLSRLRELVGQILDFPIFSQEAHPNVWLGLGYLGSVEGLGAELVQGCLDRLAEELEPHPQEKVEALLRVYPGADQERRVQVEQRLRSIFGSESASRSVLKACLTGLERLLQRGEFLVEPQMLVADLCRTVLMKSKEANLQTMMVQALSYSSEGDGILEPTVWDREDRDSALRILGLVVVHEATDGRLHRMVLVRLFSFLEDWLAEIEKGEDLYACRDTPLFDILDDALHQRPGEVGTDYGASIGRKLMELHRKVPHHLSLEWRESTQRFLLTLVEKDLGVSSKLDLPDSILNALMELQPVEEQETPVSRYLLEELHRRCQLRPELQTRLERYLLTS